MRDLTRGRWIIVWAAAAAVPAVAPAQTSETTPPPGEEVMRPTEHGLRLTPAMARVLTSAFMSGGGDLESLEMTEEQKRLLAEATARRMMSIAHRDGREGQAGMEYLIETAFASMDGGGLKIRDYREFADKMQPLVRSGRDLFKGFCEDARPILDAEQMKQFETLGAKADQFMERLEQRLEDCRAGRYGDGKDPFEGLDDEDQSESPAPEPKVNEKVKQAQNQARWDVQRVTTWNWSGFLAGASVAFKFDEAQKAKGRDLLTQYEKKAEAIQTPEWKARVRRNRVQVNLRPQLGEVPSGPYVYRLEKEYKEAMRPLRELTGEFFREVLALATPEQRTEAMADAQKVFEECGLMANAEELAWLQGLLRQRVGE